MSKRKKVIIKENIKLGDVIETITKATGIKKAVEIFMDGKDCGCDKRKEYLNKLLPIRFKANCFTEKQYNDWKDFKEVRTITISSQQVRYVCELYADIFSKPVSNCSPQPLITMIDRLDLVYDSYAQNN